MDLRGIDVLVAEKVMGWTHKDVSLRECLKITGDLGRTHLWFTPNGAWEDEPPNYSSEIAAAWRVVEKMRSDYFSLSIECYNDGDADVDFTSSLMYHDTFSGYAESVPLAICLAALKAKGVEVPTK